MALGKFFLLRKIQNRFTVVSTRDVYPSQCQSLVFSTILCCFPLTQVVLCALESPCHHMPPSDLILLNLSLANLLTSLFRTVPIFISDLGLEVSLETSWCRLFMLLWVWWRSVGSWATLSLSIFHYTTLRRKHVAMGPQAQQRDRRRVILGLGLVWGANLVFSLPAAIYSRHVHGNATSELMVISCTTRPLLGCMWEFPSRQQGVTFATTSLALNEVSAPSKCHSAISTDVESLHILVLLTGRWSD